MGAQPTVMVTITLRPGTRLRRSPAAGVKGLVKVAFVAGLTPMRA